MGWTLDTPGDEVLVSGIGDRDQAALAEVYRRHGGAVWSVAQQVCSSATRAEEVCERVFTELWARPDRFDPARGPLRSWLVAQAHAHAQAGVADLPGQVRRPDGHVPAEPTPPSVDVEVAGHAATLRESRWAVDQLAGPERDALLLVYLGGHSLRATARLLGTSEGVVKGHIRRGLVNLRQVFDAKGVSE